MILDEATSSLDTESEKLVQDAEAEALREVLAKGLEELNISNESLIGEPNISQFDKSDDKIEVTVKVAMRPEIELGDYSSMAKEFKKPVVKDTKKEAKEPAPKKKKVVKKRTEAKAAKPVVAKEEVYIPEPVVDVPVEQNGEFADMATAWLNRDKPIISEKDKKVKNVIRDALEAKPEVVEEVVAVVPPKPELPKSSINDIKIKAILDSAKSK